MNKVSELSDDLEAVSVVLGELKRELRTHRRFISTLLHIFHGITDFRESYKVKYNLENIICMCLLIAMRGKFTSFYNAALFIKIRADYFRKFNLIKDNEIPSHDTLRRIFMNIDANELRDVIIKRIQEFLKKIVTAKNENDENSDKKTVRLLSGDGKMLEVQGAGAAKIPLKVNATLMFSIFTMHPPAAVSLLFLLKIKIRKFPHSNRFLIRSN